MSQWDSSQMTARRMCCYSRVWLTHVTRWPWGLAIDSLGLQVCDFSIHETRKSEEPSLGQEHTPEALCSRGQLPKTTRAQAATRWP